MKTYIAIFILLLTVFCPGCTVPGSGNPPAIDDSVTLLAEVNAPQIGSDGILPAIASKGTENDTAAFARLLASSTCKVNGIDVEFSIGQTDRELKIEKIPPSAVYEIELQSGRLKLMAVSAHVGRTVRFADGLSLRSSSELLLRKTIGSFEKIGVDKFISYRVRPALVDAVADFMASSLKKTDLDWNDFVDDLDQAIAGTLKGKSFEDCMQIELNTSPYSGRYLGRVLYYVLNAAGIPELAVAADATVDFSSQGSRVIGNISLVPVGVSLLVPRPQANPPSDIEFSFQGQIVDGLLKFTRIGANNGSPLAGKNIDNWLIFAVSDGLAVRIDNVDRAYFSGLQSRSGEFMLKKK